MVVLGRSQDHGAPGRANYLIYAALLCLGYVLFYGWLLAKSEWLPYVMDNNESFSSLWHATNLYHFGLEHSFGLTDEAYGFAPEAHPYVYTHQGNFPRLFALILYAAGARTVEAQIVITTFTIGLAALLLAFTFLSRLSGNRAFAALACTLLFTDYVLVAQWQVVTYRVWHAFFVFAVFLCVDRFDRDLRGWLLLALASACLFYFELIFAVFIAVAAGLYVLLRNSKRPGTAVLAGTALGAGGLLSVFVLCAQIVLYMGWDAFLRDAGYTFTARNHFSDTGSAVAVLREFMESNRIVFWYNLFDASGYRTPFHLLASVTDYELQIHTPHLILLLVLPATIYAGMFLELGRATTKLPWLQDSVVRWTRYAVVRVLPYAFVAGYLLHRWWRGKFGWLLLLSLALIGVLLCLVWLAHGARGRRAPLAGLAVLAAGLVGLTFIGSLFVVLLLALFSPFGLGAWPMGGVLSFAWIAPSGLVYAAAAATVVYLLVIRDRSAGTGVTRLVPKESSIPALSLAIEVNVAAIIVMLAHALLYQPHYQMLWREITNFILPAPLPQLLVVLAILLVHGVAQMGYERLRADPLREVVKPVGLFLCAGYAAYAIVYFLSPGYVLTGYRFRLAPFSVFVTDVMIALGIYLIYRLAAAVTAWRGWRAPQRWGVAAGALVILQWANNQAAYMSLVPPDGLGILKTLSQPPYRGASFVSNTYAAPFAAFTGQWAYNDPELAKAIVEERDGVRRLKTSDHYLWLADRDRNPDYRRPQYFICLMPQSLSAVQDQLQKTNADGPGYSGCGHMGIVRYAVAGRKDVLPRAELIAMDTEGRRKNGYESWAILRLDWGP